MIVYFIFANIVQLLFQPARQRKVGVNWQNKSKQLFPHSLSSTLADTAHSHVKPVRRFSFWSMAIEEKISGKEKLIFFGRTQKTFKNLELNFIL